MPKVKGPGNKEYIIIIWLLCVDTPCSVFSKNLTTRPKISAVLTLRSITWDSSTDANYHTYNKVVVAIKQNSLIQYFTILSSGYQKSDYYIFYAVLFIMFLSIIFLSNIYCVPVH